MKVSLHFGFAAAALVMSTEAAGGLSKSLDGFKLPENLGIFGKKGDEKKSVCGDGVTDLQTEECDDGSQNGQPGSFCLGNCTFVPEARCGDLLIDSTTTLADAQVCRTAGDIDFELDEAVDVSLPNLVFARNIKGTTNTNLMKSLTMRSLLVGEDLDFNDDSTELVSIYLPSLRYLEGIDINDVPNLQTVKAPSLISVYSDIEFEDCPEMTSFDFSSLTYVEDFFELVRMEKIVDASLPNLVSATKIELTDTPLLSKADYPNLFRLGDFDLKNAPSLEVFRAPLLTLLTRLQNVEIEAPLGSSNTTVLQLCSLPAFQARWINDELCTGACTVESAVSKNCGKGEKKSVGGLFNLEGALKGGAVFDSFDLTGKLLGNGVNSMECRGWKTQRGTRRSRRTSAPTRTQPRCPKRQSVETTSYVSFLLLNPLLSPPFPASVSNFTSDFASLSLILTHCKHSFGRPVEVGEECDGDQRICDNSVCRLKDSSVCQLGSLVEITSASELENVLGDCAVVFGGARLSSGVTGAIELPLLQAWFGTLSGPVSSGSAFSVPRISFPSAWTAPSLLFQNSDSTEIESVDLPCTRTAGTFDIANSPAFSRLNAPLAKTTGNIEIADSCSESSPFDLEFPEAFFIGAIRVTNCPGLRQIRAPFQLGSATETSLQLINNTNLELVSQPKLSVFESEGIQIEGSPKLGLVDRSSQVVIRSFSSITSGGESETGEIKFLFCSLWEFDANESVLPNCQETDDPPCVVVRPGDEECKATKKEKEGGGFGLDLGFDLKKAGLDEVNQKGLFG
uniref:Receptor L-domain domain-containing protein n=1 Tax=Chromera velia CCMP2878 TaxID=1169474 RepID=A0A0G4F7V0_9ALVE|eukprot:Cvel_15535.t1-p1 / transcript=Cvel_15535.t1 / gene=Cvel_15535 / organism=Chromera_velia_CCMP2878 / gene_product=hypothetical protein / transcript_product=hypothetical protein / location=Cvel_scaffold1154:12534-15498(-) / protein_length=792 / sequence_SO=supercontig / SO=protein_coding / is_pseudo=false